MLALAVPGERDERCVRQRRSHRHDLIRDHVHQRAQRVQSSASAHGDNDLRLQPVRDRELAVGRLSGSGCHWGKRPSMWLLTGQSQMLSLATQPI